MKWAESRVLNAVRIVLADGVCIGAKKKIDEKILNDVSKVLNVSVET